MTILTYTVAIQTCNVAILTDMLDSQNETVASQPTKVLTAPNRQPRRPESPTVIPRSKRFNTRCTNSTKCTSSLILQRLPLPSVSDYIVAIQTYTFYYSDVCYDHLDLHCGHLDLRGGHYNMAMQTRRGHSDLCCRHLDLRCGHLDLQCDTVIYMS